MGGGRPLDLQANQAGRVPNQSERLRRTAGRTLSALVVLATLLSCGETVLQIDPADVVELRVSADSALVFVSRTVQLRAYPLDETGGLLVGQDVHWTSANEGLATVDGEGLVTGVAVGSVNVVASIGALRDTTVVTVTPLPALVLSADSIGFTVAAGGADPAPDSVQITNGGGGTLVVTVDSIVYGAGATGWLTAQLGGSAAPTPLELAATSSGVTTAGTYVASVWVSGADAEDSPAAIEVTLRINAGSPASMTINDGNGQSRTAGFAVTVAPSVSVLDGYGNAAVGASVAFAVTGGGGQVTGSPATVSALGVARVGSWTLGQTAGPNQLTATLGGLTPVVFAATGTVGPATQVVVTDGNNQNALAGSAVATPPTVSVRDQFGNGVAGVGVTFAVTSGGGGVTGASQTTAGIAGAATVGSWTLGISAGTNTLSATAAGVGTPAVITATGLTGAADSIYHQAGNAQSDTVAATLPVAYSVRVVDTNGNGVQGVAVTWAVTGGGGSFQNITSTDANGYSTAVRVLGTAPGAHTATAAVGGLAGSPVGFSATAAVGSPAAITVTAGAAQTDTVAQIVPIAPQVRVADKFNNPIQSNAVTFQVTAGGGTVAPMTPIMTLANGTATVTSWQLGQTAGANRDTLTATATGPGITGNPIRIVASSVAGAPTQFLILSGDGQTAVTGTNVATAPIVVLRDVYNNGVSGRTINFTTTGGSVGTPAPTTGANGQASTTWAPNVSGGTVQTNGTFPDTLSAATAGFTTLRVLASARYSFATHVNAIFITNCSSGCHGYGGSSGNMNFDGTVAQNHAQVVNVVPFCDGALGALYRRVSNAGGVAAAETYSILIRKLDPNFPGIGGCGAHSGGEFTNGAPQLAILHAWIRNGAPNN